MPRETHELYAAARKAIGAKLVADSLNVGVQHVYKLSADPDSLDAPVRDDLARITNLMHTLAARPHAKPALILFRLYFEDLFAQLVDHDSGPRALTNDCIPAHVGKLCREFGELVVALQPGFDSSIISNEGAEVIAAVECLIRAAEASDGQPTAIRKIG